MIDNEMKIGNLAQSTQLFILVIFIIVVQLFIFSFLPRLAISWLLFKIFVYFGIVETFVFKDVVIFTFAILLFRFKPENIFANKLKNIIKELKNKTK